MRMLPIVKLVLLIIALYVLVIASNAFIEQEKYRRADHVHRYQKRLYLGQFEPYPVECWADSHPEVAWPARKDGNCFLEDAPWLKSWLR
jgi:hypothetical protein